MSSVGDALLFTAMIVSAIVVFGYFASEKMFELNADERGYDIHHGYDLDGCYSEFHEPSGIVTQFCKANYGFLGINDWILKEDKEFTKGVIADFVDSKPTPECEFGVKSFKMISNGTESIVEYDCVVPWNQESKLP